MRGANRDAAAATLRHAAECGSEGTAQLVLARRTVNGLTSATTALPGLRILRPSTVGGGGFWPGHRVPASTPIPCRSRHHRDDKSRDQCRDLGPPGPPAPGHGNQIPAFSSGDIRRYRSTLSSLGLSSCASGAGCSAEVTRARRPGSPRAGHRAHDGRGRQAAEPPRPRRCRRPVPRRPGQAAPRRGLPPVRLPRGRSAIDPVPRCPDPANHRDQVTTFHLTDGEHEPVRQAAQ